MIKKYNLLLDDERTIENVVEVTGNQFYLDNEWVIVRSFDEFKKVIVELGIPNIVSFDHDIADFTEDGMERNGLTCCKYLVDICIENDCYFPTYYIHSANPSGSNNIRNYIENYINLKDKGFFNG